MLEKNPPPQRPMTDAAAADVDTSAHAGALSIGDVQVITRMMGEISGMTGEVQCRRRALLDGLTSLVGADSWIWSSSTGYRTGEKPIALGMASGGLSEKQLNAVLEYTTQEEHPRTEQPKTIEALGPWKHVTRSRTDLVPDERYYSSPLFDSVVAKMGFDHYLFSMYPLDGGVISGVSIHRRTGKPDFTDREKMLMHLVLSEVDWVHANDLPADISVQAPKLSPRRRHVFGHLLRGWPRKKIADELGLTPNTVAGYQKDIYRHFSVNSQPELLARFLQGEHGECASNNSAARDGETCTDC